MNMELTSQNREDVASIAKNIFASLYAEREKNDRDRNEKFETRIFGSLDKLGDRLEKSSEKQFSQTKEYLCQEIKIVSQNGESARSLIASRLSELEKTTDSKLTTLDDFIHKKATKEDIKNAIKSLKLEILVGILGFFITTGLIAWQWALPELIKKMKGA